MQHKSNYSINKLQILQIFIYFKHLVMTYIKLMTHSTLRDTTRHHTILKKSLRKLMLIIHYTTMQTTPQTTRHILNYKTNN